MGDNIRITAAFAAVVELALALDVGKLDELDGCWEHQVDDAWHISLNGHNREWRDSGGVELPPFACYVSFNGWPAGIVAPCGGALAVGEAANEQAFIAAVKAAAERAKSGSA